MISILNYNIPAYGLMMVTGFLVSLIYIIIFSENHSENTETLIYVYVLSAVAALVGAKVLYILTILPQLCANLETKGLRATLDIYLSGGFVFYGGLIAALIAAYYWCRSFKINIYDAAAVLLPALLITAGCGRIGCSLIGCCHGKETLSPIYVMYIQSEIAPNGIHLVPTQLYEAILDFALAIYFTVCVMKNKKEHILDQYLIIYSVFRFIIEFYRGDTARGFISGLSVSQWISIGIFVAVILKTRLWKIFRNKLMESDNKLKGGMK